MNRILVFLTLIWLLSSCAVQHKSLSGLREWAYPQSQFDHQVNFGFVDDVLDKTNNKRAAKWAKRKNIHVLAIRLVNTANHPVHGSQISFLTNGGQAEIIHSHWLAKKVRQRVSPFMILFLPAHLIEYGLFHSNDDEEYYHQASNEPEAYYLTEELARKAEANRKKANFDLHRELMTFQLASQKLMPGKPVYGLIGLRSKQDLTDMRVIISEIDYRVVQ